MIITIASQKGGVSKTTTAFTLAGYLQQKNKKVLLLDLDPQGSLTLGVGLYKGSPTIADILKGSVTDIRAAICSGAFNIIPSCKELTVIDSLIKAKDKAHILSRALDQIRNEYDYIVIDTPPGQGLLTYNALQATDEVIIPVNADPFSLQAIHDIAATINSIKQYNQGLNVAGVVFTRFTPRSVINRDMRDLITRHCKEQKIPVIESYVRECVAIREAITMQQCIYKYAPKSNAAKDYTAVFNEIFKALKGKGGK